VEHHIPEAEMLTDVSAEISFQIPTTASAAFKEFFVDLDGSLERLQLITYSISVTTLEEVFIRVARGDEGHGSTDLLEPV
jgi:hypothetical protein